MTLQMSMELDVKGNQMIKTADPILEIVFSPWALLTCI